MKKYLIIIIILLISNFLLYKYLIQYQNSRIPYEFNEIDDYFIYQINDIKLNDIDDFKFNQYIQIQSFVDKPYKISHDDEYFIVHIENNEFNFEYTLIEPEIIEKYVYLEIEKQDTKDKIIENQEEETDYKQIDKTTIFNYYFSYDLDNDLDNIRNDLINNIESSQRVSIDYSKLNVSSIGQYSVFYILENEKIEIIVEIK